MSRDRVERVTFEYEDLFAWEWSVGEPGWDTHAQLYSFGRAWTERGARRKAARFIKKREAARLQAEARSTCPL